jgi:peptide/nickel transport system substrate-binding protein
VSLAENRSLARRVGHRKLGAALVLLTLVIGACGGGGGDRRVEPTRSPEPTFSAGKPGGTLRVVGTVRTVPLDPALARDDAALLVDRLVLRQLYSYRPGSSTPTPDLAIGPPALSADRLTATVALRPAKWNVPGGRGVTAGDVLRGLKRLCAPSVLAPERGYLAEVVVGYAEFCTKASRVRLGATTGVDLDTVDVPGLRAVGDTAVQIQLRRPAADLQQILALPALSPLPFEIKKGFADPQQFIGNGPYSFTEPEAGESYRLSRNSVWDPGGDPIRVALVDRVAFRGGLSAAEVQQRLQTNAADLSWDSDTPADVVDRPIPADSYRLTRVEDRDLAVLGMGTRGPAARRLAAGPARAALAACVDRAALQKAFGGKNLTTATGALLTADYLDVPPPTDTSPTATASPTAGATPTGSATPNPGSTTTTTSAPARGPSPSPSPSTATAAAAPSVPPTATPAQCRSGLAKAGLAPGSDLTLLAADGPAERAAATVLHDRLADGGLAVQLRLVPADRYAAVAALGGWDLALRVLRPDYAGSRAVLAPLLDPRWPGNAALGTLRRSPAWLTEMAAGLGEKEPERVAERELDLASAIGQDGAVLALFHVAAVRTTGPNVGPNPPVTMLGNADPANVSLGVTRPGESPSSTSPPS